ncbi:MAG: hypothetical protein JKP90_23195 [Desulfofustis sp. PB-SRB1]|nr:hypothetical protein [Desulfofustis sp. PB-SRB1]
MACRPGFERNRHHHPARPLLLALATSSTDPADLMVLADTAARLLLQNMVNPPESFTILPQIISSPRGT